MTDEFVIRAPRCYAGLTLILAISVSNTTAFAQELVLRADGSTSETVNAGSSVRLVVTQSAHDCSVVVNGLSCTRTCNFTTGTLQFVETSPQTKTLKSIPILIGSLTDGSCSVAPFMSFPYSDSETLSGGSYVFQANFGGNAPFSNTVSVVVNKLPSIMGLSVPGTPTAGSVQVTANVSPLGGGPGATGSVVYSAVVNGQIFQGSAPVNSTITLQLPASTASTTITANYPGDANLNPSTAQVTIPSIGRASSSTGTVATVPQCVSLGGSATLNVTVRGFAPSGRVDFTDNGIAVGSATASNTSNAVGSTTFQTTASLSAGGHNLVATYVGDANNLASASPTLPNQVPGIFTKATWDYSTASIGGINGFAHYFADLDGDGKKDWIQVARGFNYGWASVTLPTYGLLPDILTASIWDYSSNGGIGGINGYTHYQVDLNGDGKADWIQVANGSNYGWVSLSTPSGVPGILRGSTWDYASYGGIGGTNAFTHYHVDLNGDGKADWIQVVNGSNMGYVSLTDASGVPGIFTRGVWDYSSASIGAANAYTHYLVDLNGDGKADWIQVVNGSNLAYVSLSDASGVPGIFTKGFWDYSTASIGAINAYAHYFADLNGDGKPDWIQVARGYNQAWVSLSTPSSSVPPILLPGGNWDYSSTSIGQTNAYTHYFADLNGDRKADWIQVANGFNDGYVSLSDASGVPGILHPGGVWDYASTSIGQTSAYTHYFADLNGDGKADWIQVANGFNNGYVSLAPGSPGSCP